MENIENIITENVEDIITVIPEEVPVSTYSGLKSAGAFGLGVVVGFAVYEGGKRIIKKVKAKKAEKEATQECEVVEISDFVDENETK